MAFRVSLIFVFLLILAPLAEALLPTTSGLEGQIIRKMRVSGNYPYLEKKLLRLLSMQPGDSFHEELIPESEQRLKDFFEKRGYFGTTVKINALPDKKYSAANLTVRIKKGHTRRLGKVIVTGNTLFSQHNIRNRLDSLGHFKPLRIQKKVKRLQEKYVKRGYVRARVRLKDMVAASNKMDVTIEIEERKKMILQFRGMSWFRPQTLGGLVTFKKEQGYDLFSIKRSQQKLEQFYKLNGFLHTKIETEVEKNPEFVLVRFLISEGPRTRVKRIEFEGNESFRDSKLRKVMNNEAHSLFQQGFFREDLVSPDFDRIGQFYRDRGYFDAQIIDWETRFNRFKDYLILKIKLNEGEPYTVQEIVFDSLHAFDQKIFLEKSGLRSKREYSKKKILRAQERMIQLYLKEGYAHASSDIEEEINNHTVTLHVHLNEGPQVRIGKITIVGDFITREKEILKSIKFKEGNLYIYTKILDGQLRLKRLGIFDNIRIIPTGLEEKHETVDLEVRVQERKTVTLDVQAGFDSDKLASGQVILTKRNLFGFPKQVQLRGIGGFELSRGEFTYFSPQIFGASWNLVSQTHVQYEDDTNFNAISFGDSLGVLKHFGPRWTLLLKESIIRFNIFESESNQTALVNNLFDNTFAETQASLSFDSRDNFSDPTRGIYSLASTEFDTDLANARNNFNLINFNISHYFGLFNRLTLINTLRVGHLTRLTNGRVPANKLFFMGGNDTVRGFDEDAINASGGTTSVIYNAELHLRVFDAIKVATFFDAGSLTQSGDDVSSDTFREAAGVGLRYITPVGPIRLDYGFVLDRRVGEDGQRFHFSFGYFF